MASERRGKIGLSHWPFDSDFFDDIKIKKLVKSQGGKAPLVYIYLLGRIYRERGYYLEWDSELPFIVSYDLGSGYDEGYVLEVITKCVQIGLFDEAMFSEGVLTSLAIQTRYSEICVNLRRKCVIDKYSLFAPRLPLIDEDKSLNDANKTLNAEDKHTIELNRMEGNKKEISPNGDTKKDSDSVAPKASDEHKSLEERRQEFYNSLIPYVQKYGKEMVREFYNYWSEVSEGGRKMAWEIAKGRKGTFSIAGRLATWKKNQPKFDRGASGGVMERGISITQAVNAAVIPELPNAEQIDMSKLLGE